MNEKVEKFCKYFHNKEKEYFDSKIYSLVKWNKLKRKATELLPRVNVIENLPNLMKDFSISLDEKCVRTIVNMCDTYCYTIDPGIDYIHYFSPKEMEYIKQNLKNYIEKKTDVELNK
jgi:hypothetical protein